MRKGISPLIAAVLLIAFTMGIAGIAGPYLTQVMQQSTQGQQEEARDVLDASKAGLNIRDATYSSSTNETTITIENTGSIEIRNYTVSVFGDDSNQTIVNEPLKQGKIKQVTVGTSSTPENIQVQSNNLPVSDQDQITGEPPEPPEDLSVTS